MIGAYPGYDGQQRKMARVYFENSASQVAPSDIYSRAVTLGKTADIYQARGQLDEALRILQAECRPAIQTLGDIHSWAVTLGKIADIYQARGQLDEALRILKDEQLPESKAVSAS